MAETFATTGHLRNGCVSFDRCSLHEASQLKHQSARQVARHAYVIGVGDGGGRGSKGMVFET